CVWQGRRGAWGGLSAVSGRSRGVVSPQVAGALRRAQQSHEQVRDEECSQERRDAADLKRNVVRGGEVGRVEDLLQPLRRGAHGEEHELAHVTEPAVVEAEHPDERHGHDCHEGPEGHGRRTPGEERSQGCCETQRNEGRHDDVIARGVVVDVGSIEEVSDGQRRLRSGCDDDPRDSPSDLRGRGQRDVHGIENKRALPYVKSCRVRREAWPMRYTLTSIAMTRPKTISDDEILSAARKLFRAHGHAVSTRQVAESAGISEGVLYQRFVSKDELFFAAMAPSAPDLEEVLGPE